VTPFFWFRIARRVVVLLVVAVLLVTGFTAVRVWWVARQDDRRSTDAIVVLGAAQYDGRPSNILEARLDHAAKLYADGVAPRVVTVGGSRPGDRFTEAEAGKAWLADHGVPEADVVAVRRGGETLSSLAAVTKLFERRDWQTATLVTDPWHTLRAQAMADDLGLDVVSSPTRQGPAVRTRETQARSVGRETLAYLYYRLFNGSPEMGLESSPDTGSETGDGAGVVSTVG
jgi:uncharacterized SAM-binding protein YcdF (DUF218 family)